MLEAKTANTNNPIKNRFGFPFAEILFPIKVANINGPKAAIAPVQPKTPAACR